MSILGSDSAITTSISSDPLGSDELGVDPLGGSTIDAIPGLAGVTSTMLRFSQADSVKRVDYTEQYVEYSMNSVDGQFCIVAHGSNQTDTGTVWRSHKK
jgi:hypothetical protein